MTFDENLATRVRSALSDRSDVVEKKMFGGLTFMVRGHMACGVTGEDLMVRVGTDGYEDALARPHAREMDFTGRSLKGFVFVAPGGFETAEGLADWVGRGLAHAESLPPK